MFSLKWEKSIFKKGKSIIEWNESMSVGVAALDADHKKIVVLINDLYRAIDRGDSDAILSDIFVDLFQYISEHDAREESLLQRTNYPDCVAHEQQHAARHKELEAVFAKYLTHDEDHFLAIDVLSMLCKWWEKHVLQTDMKYKAHLRAHGVR